MNTSRSLNQVGERDIRGFDNELAAASAWRRKELVKLLTAFDLQYRKIRQQDPLDASKTVFRYEYMSAIAADHDFVVSAMAKRTIYLIAYSHWEGYVKQAVGIYLKSLNYISMSEVPSHPKIAKKLILWKLEQDRALAVKIEDYSVEAMHVLRESLKFYNDDLFRLVIEPDKIEKIVATGTNLNFGALKELFKRLDLSLPSHFSGANIGILDSMVDIRNGIAHGDPRFRDSVLPGEQRDGLTRTVDFVLDSISEVQDVLIEKADETFKNSNLAI